MFKTTISKKIKVLNISSLFLVLSLFCFFQIDHGIKSCSICVIELCCACIWYFFVHIFNQIKFHKKHEYIFIYIFYLFWSLRKSNKNQTVNSPVSFLLTYHQQQHSKYHQSLLYIYKYIFIYKYTFYILLLFYFY